jgi:ParB-like chromosome segregation protein Spo0J
MSGQDNDVLRQIVARLVLPIAWLLATGRRYSHKELALRVMEGLTPAERDVAVRDWADRRPLDAKGVTDPAERTLHGLMLLIRPAVERLRGLGYATFGTDFEMQYQLDGKKWQESQWGPQIEATFAAFDKAREAVEPVVADGKLGKAEALRRIHAALPGDWDRVLRGVVADELLAAVQPYLTSDAEDADNELVPPQTGPFPEPVVPRLAGDGADGADVGEENGNVQDSAAPEQEPAEQQSTVIDKDVEDRPAPAEQTRQQSDVIDMPVAELRLHGAAADIPAMRAEEWELFLEDVRARGVEAALLVQKGGVILDGRSRWEAAKQCGLETVPVVLTDLGEAEQTIAMYRAAVVRRNLGDDQRAMIAQDYLELLSRRGRTERARKAGLAGGKGRPKVGNSLGAKLTPELSDPGEPANPEPQRRSRELVAAALNVAPSKLRAAKELAREDAEAAAEVRGGKKTLRRARKDLKAKKSAGGDTGKSAKTPADARGQGAPRTKTCPKEAIGSTSGEFRTLTQDLDRADRALAEVENKLSKVASRLTGEARKKLKTRLGKFGSRQDGLVKLVGGEVG